MRQTYRQIDRGTETETETESESDRERQRERDTDRVAMSASTYFCYGELLEWHVIGI